MKEKERFCHVHNLELKGKEFGLFPGEPGAREWWHYTCKDCPFETWQPVRCYTPREP